MKKILTACLMAALCQSAFADDRWKYIGKVKDGEFEIYIDTYRSTRESVWVQYFHLKKPHKGTKEYTQFSVNCTNKQISRNQKIVRDETGNVIYSEQFNQQLKKEVPPESIGEAIVNYICTPPQATNNEALNRAALELNQWRLEKMRTEPEKYALFEPVYRSYVERVLPGIPPEKWLDIIGKEYFMFTIDYTDYYAPNPKKEIPLSPINRR